MAHEPSANPGRYQPLRSPNSPPVFSAPRTGSAVSTLPWIRQVTAVAAPASAAPVSPRASFCVSSARKSSLWPMFSTSTDTTLPVPAATDPAGNVNVCLASPVLPRNVPLSQTDQTPARPVTADRLIPVSAPVPVKWPRYHTSPWWNP